MFTMDSMTVVVVIVILMMIMVMVVMVVSPASNNVRYNLVLESIVYKEITTSI